MKNAVLTALAVIGVSQVALAAEVSNNIAVLCDARYDAPLSERIRSYPIGKTENGYRVSNLSVSAPAITTDSNGFITKCATVTIEWTKCDKVAGKVVCP